MLSQQVISSATSAVQPLCAPVLSDCSELHSGMNPSICSASGRPGDVLVDPADLPALQEITRILGDAMSERQAPRSSDRDCSGQTDAKSTDSPPAPLSAPESNNLQIKTTRRGRKRKNRANKDAHSDSEVILRIFYFNSIFHCFAGSSTRTQATKNRPPQPAGYRHQSHMQLVPGTDQRIGNLPAFKVHLRA